MFREECESLAAEQLDGHNRIEVAESADLEFDRVTLRTPDYNRALLSGLSFKLACGDSLLVRGPSGVGKTSLLRPIPKLWQAAEAPLLSPAPRHTFFPPQPPSLTL